MCPSICHVCIIGCSEGLTIPPTLGGALHRCGASTLHSNHSQRGHLVGVSCLLVESRVSEFSVLGGAGGDQCAISVDIVVGGTCDFIPAEGDAFVGGGRYGQSCRGLNRGWSARCPK